MLIIHGVVIDDDPTTAARYTNYIKKEWTERKLNYDIDIQTINNFEDGSKRLIDDHNPINFCFLDLIDEKTKSDKGTELIQDAKTNHPNCVIIIVTKGNKASREIAENLGASVALYKEDLKVKENVPQYFVDIIIDNLNKKGIHVHPLRIVVPEYDVNDFNLVSILEYIGFENVLAFLEKIVGSEIKKLTYKSIKKGRSDTFVFLSDITYGDKQYDKNIKLIIKVSRNMNLIAKEFQKNEESRNYFREGITLKLFPKSNYDKNIDGWYFLVSEYSYDSLTFYDWIHESSLDENRINHCLNVLFSDSGLRHTYTHTSSLEDRNPVSVILDLLDNSKRAKIKDSISDLTSLANKYDSKNYFKKEVIELLVDKNQIKGVDIEHLYSNSYISIVHKDFHSRNILVDNNNNPHIIDLTDFGYSHWATDVAFFFVDLLITGYDNDLSQYEWEKLNEWTELYQNIVDNKKFPDVDEKDKNFGIVYTLRWLLNNLNEIFPDKYNIPKIIWEFWFLVSVEFLKFSYREYVSAPKRTAALICCSYTLQKLPREYTKVNSDQNIS